MSGPKDGYQDRTFVDNTGAAVTGSMPNPSEVDNDNTPGVGYRPNAPADQLFGPAQNEPADYIPFD